jgi:hypothetical protein
MSDQPAVVKEWHAKVVGVSFKNADGSDRQQLIRRFCREGSEVQLRAEPDNAHDTNAHGVWVEWREWFVLKRQAQIGYLSTYNAQDIASKKRTGHSFKARIATVLDGPQSAGVVLLITQTWRPLDR